MNMKRNWIGGGLLAVYAIVAGAAAPVTPSRGELLYTTHCIACHNEQVHWREKKLARNWKTLVAEVDRWQANGNLAWNADDIDQVARHLNAVHYHYRQPNK